MISLVLVHVAVAVRVARPHGRSAEEDSRSLDSLEFANMGIRCIKLSSDKIQLPRQPLVTSKVL